MSLTILSLAVIVLGQVIRGAGFEIADENLTQFIVTATQILGAVGVYWGRFRKGDLSVLGIRK